MFGYDLGIDLGTSSIVISVVGKGVVLSEPAYVAYDVNRLNNAYADRFSAFKVISTLTGIKHFALINVIGNVSRLT